PSSDHAVSVKGDRLMGWWSGKYHGLTKKGQLPTSFQLETDGPMLFRFAPDGETFIMASTSGIVKCFNLTPKRLWDTDLNLMVPQKPKHWVANARATPIEKGVWQIPGGRVESDLGGQRLIEAPDGYILIEGHAGLSFEREQAAIAAVGLLPSQVKYVLATH